MGQEDAKLPAEEKDVPAEAWRIGRRASGVRLQAAPRPAYGDGSAGRAVCTVVAAALKVVGRGSPGRRTTD